MSAITEMSVEDMRKEIAATRKEAATRKALGQVRVLRGTWADKKSGEQRQNMAIDGIDGKTGFQAIKLSGLAAFMQLHEAMPLLLEEAKRLEAQYGLL